MSVELPTGVMPQYEKYIIKPYKYWTLLVNVDQKYLCRSVLWLRRPGEMQRLSKLYPQEEFELFRIMDQFEHALDKLWKPDHMNYEWLGNLFHEHKGHGHMHIIPRYENKRVFAGTTFTDGRYGQNFRPYAKRILPDDILFKIRDAVREALAGK